MYYAPHILQLKVVSAPDTDPYGRVVIGTGGEHWQDICRCRCDDDTTEELVSDNAEVYRSRWHVVSERNGKIKAGDTIRCIERDGAVRGEGVVRIPKRTNYYAYEEYWV